MPLNSRSTCCVPRVFSSTLRPSSTWPRSTRLLGVSGRKMPPAQGLAAIQNPSRFKRFCEPMLFCITDVPHRYTCYAPSQSKGRSILTRPQSQNNKVSSRPVSNICRKEQLFQEVALSHFQMETMGHSPSRRMVPGTAARARESRHPQIRLSAENQNGRSTQKLSHHDLPSTALCCLLQPSGGLLALAER